MAKKFFDIAHILVSLEILDEKLWGRISNLASFEAGTASDPVLEFSQVEALGEEEPEPLLVSDDKGFPRITVAKTDRGEWFFTMAPLDDAPVSCRCICSEDFSKARFEVLERKHFAFSVNNAMMLVYALRTSSLGCLEIHASVIMKDGKAVAFLGKSGTGKSTHTRLWQENIPDCELLNDDNPIVCCRPGGEVFICGSPWSGKTPCYKKKEVPLAAVVRLNQAPFNRIKKLSGIQAYAALYPSVSAYRPERKVADGIHDSISKVAASVPCYNLECLPDGEAALLSYSTVYGKG